MKRKVVITAAIIIIAAAAIAIYIKLSAAMVIPDGDAETSNDYNVIGTVESKTVGFDMFPVDGDVEEETTTSVTMPEIYGDNYEVDTDFLYMPYSAYCDVNREADGLLGQVRRFEKDALTVVFDNIEFSPGKYVREIVDCSHWYTVLENNEIPAGESAFCRLENDFWTNDEIKLVGTKDVSNGDIVLWVHNYSDEAALLRDCVIYKFQISYLGCWDYFSEHPDLLYADTYTFGTNNFAEADSVRGVTLDTGSCIRHFYGDVSECEVWLDSDDNGLRAITVSYNEYFGPEFNYDINGGDKPWMTSLPK